MMSRRAAGSVAMGFHVEGPAIHSPAHALAVSPALPSSGVAFLSQRTDSEGVDRAFFHRVLAALIAATLACGAVALSALVTITPVAG